MSLLLDALKKAAEKKAQKSAEQGIDATEADLTEQTEAMTGVNPDMDATRTETTGVDSTQIDATEADLTRADETQVDSTQIDASDSSDPTLLDTTQLDATEHDATERDATLLDTTRLDATQVDATEIDATEHDATLLDTTQLDATKVDATEQDATLLDTTQLDATQRGATETTHSGGFQNNESPDSESRSVELSGDADEISSSIDQSDETGQSSEQATTTDDEVTVVGEGEETRLPGNATILDSTQTLPTVEQMAALSAGSEEALTEDDVTDFMGDGYRDPTLSQSDDTTLTNPESLTLTNFGYVDEDASLPPSGHFDTHDKTTTENVYMQGVPDEDQSTRVNTDATRTDSAVDIEQLTSDETVTVEGKTSTRTFAPDNYDRTLVNLSDQDVSRIFPGMKPESDVVMTPDYAKRVFQSKSSHAKTGYFKWYGGLALLLLMVVVLFGMFQLVDESEVIDQKLARLKNDPMPGVIQPQKAEPSPRLFDADRREADEQAARVLAMAEAAKAEMEDASLASPDNVSANTSEQQASPETVEDEITTQTAQARTESAGTTAPQQSIQDGSTSEAPSVATVQTSAAREQTARSGAAGQNAQGQSDVQQASDNRLVITRGEKADPQTQLLVQAYQAYQQGDLAAAAAQYDQVLAQDPVNRDALLGRAAVYVQQNDYQAAINLYQRQLEQNPKDSLAMTALISVANIDPQAAESQLKTMLDEQPDSPYLHFALGNLYGSQNRWSEAQKAYFSALSHKPQDADYAYNLAVSLDHLRKRATAAQFYRRALKLAGTMRTGFDTNLARQRLEVLTQ